MYICIVKNSDMVKRKTGKDYMKDLKTYREELESLELQITNRLGELIRNHPDAVIDNTDGEDTHSCYLKPFYEKLGIDRQVEYILLIEKWLEGKNMVRQLTIDGV